PHGCTLIALDVDLRKTWNDYQVHLVLFQIAARDRNRFDRLVHGAGADRLDLCIPLLTHHARNGTGDGGRTRLGRNFDEFSHGSLPPIASTVHLGTPPSGRRVNALTLRRVGQWLSLHLDVEFA